MITRIFASLLLVFLLAGVCLAADKPLSDDAIVDQVRLKLVADPDVKGGGLTVDCKDGVVTISGAVESTRAKDKAVKLAKKVKGVKQVVDHLTTGDRPVGK
jgi:osmotically-inducible protein OsmY